MSNCALMYVIKYGHTKRSHIHMHAHKTINYTNRAIGSFVVLAAIYFILIFILPTSKAIIAHHLLSPYEYRVATALVGIPTVAVWFAAFWGYAKIQEYSHAIRKSTEGKYFKLLTHGLGWLAWGLPFVSIVTLTLEHTAIRYQSFEPTSIVLSNYVALVIQLIAFYVIATAASGMVGEARPSLSLSSARVLLLFFLTGGVLFCFLAFRNVYILGQPTTANAYHLPVSLVIITLIIPYLYAWFIGLQSVYEIYLYTMTMNGKLYRRKLRLVVLGLVLLIISYVAIQFLNVVMPRNGALIFDARLFSIIVVRVIEGLGFLTLAIGATQLLKIEEV